MRVKCRGLIKNSPKGRALIWQRGLIWQMAHDLWPVESRLTIYGHTHALKSFMELISHSTNEQATDKEARSEFIKMQFSHCQCRHVGWLCRWLFLLFFPYFCHISFFYSPYSYVAICQIAAQQVQLVFCFVCCFSHFLARGLVAKCCSYCCICGVAIQSIFNKLWKYRFDLPAKRFAFFLLRGII